MGDEESDGDEMDRRTLGPSAEILVVRTGGVMLPKTSAMGRLSLTSREASIERDGMLCLIRCSDSSGYTVETSAGFFKTVLCVEDFADLGTFIDEREIKAWPRTGEISVSSLAWDC